MKQNGRQKPGFWSVARLWRALGHSWAGLKISFATETAFRQEVALCAVLLPVLFFLPLAWPAKAWMASALLLVLMAELINSAIETLADRISPAPHELSGRAKDIGSAVVLLALIHAGLVWAGMLSTLWRH